MARHETDPKTGDELYYQEVQSPAGVYFLCGVAGAFGLLALLGFFNRMAYAGPDEYFLLVMGILCCLFAWRFWLITLRPYFLLTPSRLTVRKLLRTRSWKYDDVTALASFPTFVQATINGKKAQRVPVHYLGVRTRNGKFSRVVLPEHGGNEVLLKSLTENSLVPIAVVEGEMADFEAWGKARG